MPFKGLTSKLSMVSRSDFISGPVAERIDRKSTRLNSSHLVISYAVFCLKKKKNNNRLRHRIQYPPTTSAAPLAPFYVARFRASSYNTHSDRCQRIDPSPSPTRCRTALDA